MKKYLYGFMLSLFFSNLHAQPAFVKLYFPGYQLSSVHTQNADFKIDSSGAQSLIAGQLKWKGEAMLSNRLLFGLDFTGLLNRLLMGNDAFSNSSKLPFGSFGTYYGPLVYMSLGATNSGKENKRWGLSFNYGIYNHMDYNFTAVGFSWYGVYAFKNGWYFTPKITSDFAFIEGSINNRVNTGYSRSVDLSFGKTNKKGWALGVSPIYQGTSFLFTETNNTEEKYRSTQRVFQIQLGLMKFMR